MHVLALAVLAAQRKKTNEIIHHPLMRIEFTYCRVYRHMQKPLRYNDRQIYMMMFKKLFEIYNRNIIYRMNP